MAQDYEIVRRCLGGDQTAYEELVLRYQDRALRLAIGLLGDKQLAEDAVQEAYFRCFRGLPRLSSDVAFSTWLYQSVVWAAQTHARSRRRWATLLGRLGRVPTSDLAYEKSETKSTLLAAIRKLPADLREVVLLRYYLDLPESEMATMLECPVGTVKSRTSNALKRLRQAPGLSDLIADSGIGGISNVRT
jgi:RNA polymerase sigma factor (sigma-70 family)